MGFFFEDDQDIVSAPLIPPGTDIRPDVAGVFESIPLGADALVKGGRVEVGDELLDRLGQAWSEVVAAAPDDPEVQKQAAAVDFYLVNSMSAGVQAVVGGANVSPMRETYERALRAVEPVIHRLRAVEGPQRPLRTADEALLDATLSIREAEDKASRANQFGVFVGGTGVSMVQPTNVLTMPMTAARSASWATKMLYQAGLNAALETGVQVTKTAGYRQRLGLDWSPGSAALDVGMAAVGGAAFEGLGLAAAAGWRTLRGRPDWLAEIGKAVSDPRVLDLMDAATGIVEDAAAAQARNPFASVAGSATAHLEALDAAQKAAAEGTQAPGIIDAMNGRVAELERLEAEAGTRLLEAEEADAAQARGSVLQWAQSVARRGLAWSLGVDPTQIRVERVAGADGGREAVRLTLPDGRAVDLPEAGVERVLEVGDEVQAQRGGVLEARRTIDALTDELGVQRIPASARERAAASLDRIRGERTALQTALAEARTQASRVVGDALGKPGGRAFRQRRQAEDWARRNNLGDFEVVKRKRGYVVRQVTPLWLVDPAPPARPGAEVDARALDVMAARLAENNRTTAAQDAAMAEAVEAATRATGNRDMTAAEVDAWHRSRYDGQGKSAADALDENDEALLATLNDDDLAAEVGQSENGTLARDRDGVASTRPLSEILREADEEIGALRAIRECIIGG